ncbi:hypothetical protein O181_006335 [Austropuccinia psidii MF-1]|uniref:Integrase catalytic domain-containing protein n=1 Tax=Austropuccinia psidii MF-1 TaxID=1389203 RepID=A0A9Q3BKU4_9BASI|nr:hypothetical protein [Austropuccinia psidii MF-1]
MNQVDEGSSLSSTDDDVNGKSGFYVGEEINHVSNSSSNQTFILDTGASTTTISNLELLIDPKPTEMLIKTFSGSASINHTGQLNLNGTIIQPVFYAPNGNTNLISLSQLEDQGIRVFHNNQKLILKSGEKIVMQFPRKGKLCISRTKPLINHGEISPKKDWHILLGHPSNKYLRKFLKYNNMPSLDTEYATKCEICTQCKLKRASHKNPIPAGRRPFEKIHFDLLEIKLYAKNSAQYVFVTIDEFSWSNKIMLLSNKYQAETNLISFIREIKNKTGDYPSYLHSDRGGEFSLTNLPINFWDEAANHASTIINLLPSRALKWKSPNHYSLQQLPHSTDPNPPSPPATVEPVENQTDLTAQTSQQEKPKKGFAYVPHYSTAPRNIKSRISTTNRNQQKDKHTAYLIDNYKPEGEIIMLNETIPLSEALSNKEEL